MRFYTFCNYYLSSIQQGIQSAHVLGDMIAKYGKAINSTPYVLMHEWADNHKTMIVLNGGNSADLRSLAYTMEPLAREIGFPIASFREDEQSLNCALTCVGIIVTEQIYQYNEWQAKIRRSNDIGIINTFTPNPIRISESEKTIADMIATCSLAR